MILTLKLSIFKGDDRVFPGRYQSAIVAAALFVGIVRKEAESSIPCGTLVIIMSLRTGGDAVYYSF